MAPPSGAGRHLGIVAHSIEGATLCLRTFCGHGFAEMGPHDHPDVTLDAIALARSMPAWERGDPAAVREELAESVRRVAAAGAELFACPDNTAHQALELPGEPLALPGLHIAEVVADEAVRAGHRVVGVLGTRFLMDGPVYREALARRGLRFVVPDAVDRRTVDDVIFSELVNGVLTDGSRAAYVDVIRRLADAGADAVALACTEIPLLVSPEASPLPTLDSTRLLARAAFDVSVGRLPMPSWRGGPA